MGHCCSLSVQTDAVVDRTLDLVAEAGIAVVSLPMCNMYLQDRAGGRTPRLRGVTILQELKSRGIPVSVASDNTRDPFYAYGDMDMHEVFTQAARIAHLDHPLADWPSAVTRTPADVMGLADRAGSRRAGRPTWCCSGRGTFPSCCPGPRRTGRSCAAAGRSTRRFPTTGNWTSFQGEAMSDLAGLLGALDGLPVVTEGPVMKQKSRDFYWYSPVLKRQLDDVVADAVVTVRSEAEVVAVLKAAYAHDVPVTVRGAGTGNYGQAMPLKGGMVLDLSEMTAVKEIAPGPDPLRRPG